jgi:hypothetical protein
MRFNEQISTIKDFFDRDNFIDYDPLLAYTIMLIRQADLVLG